ncbi:LysM peptidoglycan-binding domain-containing protein [Arthrobacter sp. NPDC090010]|uniref:LysM peptidoglycan-binding domain-containing protein n=1 Tax=Arthrobacter sp. NPDC090010 TaxID=3363942 RepID=UPI00382E73C8
MTLHGIDVSGWQDGIDLAAVPADFVIIKATGGTGFTSSACDRQYQAAKKAGRLRGIYHFAREQGFQGTAVEEADYFLSQTAGYLDPETILVLDWEGDNVHDVAWAKTWLDRVKARSGKTPLIYMSASVAREADWSPVAKAGYGLWIAAYILGYQQISGYMVPDGLLPVPAWPFVAMHQFTSAGRLPGWAGDLDLNVFFGDQAAWLKYAAKAGNPVAPAPSKPAPPKPAPAPVPKPTPAGTYTVKPGDTLGGIAASLGTTTAALAALNGIRNPDYIQAGQVLKTTGTAPAARTYTVKPGDTLGAIAARFGTDWPTLARLNGIPDPDRIFPGQVLRLP